MKRCIPIFLLVFCLLAPARLGAEELDMINRPVNTSGLTGLIITTSPFTLPLRTIEIGAMVLTENSLLPKYTSNYYPLTISYGLASNKEISLKAQYVALDPDNGIKARGMGDTDISFKWNVLPQPENRNRPGIALIATGTFPTGDREAGTNSVSHWGCRAGLSVGSEIVWEDLFIGLYADVQAAMQDLSDDLQKDSYTLMNAGILVPISKYRNLQMLIEFNRRIGKEIVNIDGGDYSAVTYGLRLVSEKFNFTFGTQFIHKSEEGYNNSSRVLGIVSVKM